MNSADDPKETLAPGIPSSSEQIGELKAQIAELQIQVDILKETLIVLKKDPSADRTTLRNREKAAIVGALKNRYPLPNLPKALYYARNSYYYKKTATKRVDKYVSQLEQIRRIF